MATLNAFIFQSLDGFYKDENNTTAWHEHGEEATAFSEQQLEQGNVLLFGRKTYEMMQGFWPTEMAAQLFPKVAKAMNSSEKWVVSNSMREPHWQNTEVISENAIEEIRKRKLHIQKSITVLGSGELIRQLKEADLLDSIQLLVDPIAIGKGSTLFEGTDDFINFELIDVQRFEKSSAVLFSYRVK